jgi:uncharacterized protein YdaU (DUF1376 family)
MGQIKWYKRDPSAALNGMMELSLEERGAYNTVLDLIYSRDGNLHDDDRFIAGWLRVDVRVWKRIKGALLARGKLYVDGDLLRNERADAEVLSALSRVGSARDAGLASARSKAAKFDCQSRRNSSLERTVVDTDVGTPVPTNHNHSQKEEPDGSSFPHIPGTGKSGKRTPLRGSRLPADWQPVLTPKAQATVAAWPAGMLERELTKFRNHAADKGRLSKDWQAAFRTWIDNADDWNRNDRNRTTDRRSSPLDRRDGLARACDEIIAGAADFAGGYEDDAGEAERGAAEQYLAGGG